MHIPDESAVLTQKFYFTPGDLGFFPNFDTRYARIACKIAGTSGIRRGREIAALGRRAQVIFSIRRYRLASRTTTRNSARRSSDDGGPSSAGQMAIGMACRSGRESRWIRRQTQKGDPDWSSGEIPCRRSLRPVFPKLPTTVRILVVEATPQRARKRGRTPFLLLLPRTCRIDPFNPSCTAGLDKE